MDLEKRSHRAQIRNYLKFYRDKLKAQRMDLDQTFNVAKQMSLLETMYTQDDAAEIIDGIRETVKESLMEVIGKYNRQSAKFVKHLLLQAEGEEIDVKLNVHTLDDGKLIKKIADWEGGDDSLPSQSALEVETSVNVDLVTTAKEMEDEFKNWNRKFDRLQEKTKDALKDSMASKKRLKMLNRAAENAKFDLENAGNVRAQEQEIYRLKDEIRKIRDKLETDKKQMRLETENASAELAGKIADATQFKTLRKLVQQKNAQIKELR